MNCFKLEWSSKSSKTNCEEISYMHVARQQKKEYLNPGLKPMVKPKVLVSEIFFGARRILKLFHLNIINKSITRQKLKEKLGKLQVPKQYIYNSGSTY